MEVLLVVEHLRRSLSVGISTYALGLLQGLSELDVAEVPSVTLHASRAPRGRRVDPLAVYGHRVAASRLPGPMLTRAWDRGLVGAPRDVAADLLHATSLAFPSLAKSPPTSVMVHDTAWREVPEAYPPRGRRWHEAALQRAITGARVLLVPARSAADALVAAGAPASRVAVIEEGADHLPPADLDGAQRILDGLGVRDGYLLTVGTLQPRKNLRRLLEAYALARPELPEPWPLVVVGPEGWGDALPPAAVPHGIVLAGEVHGAELAGLYRKARCLAFIPLVEGFGLPPVEAMRECTPVVASAVPSLVGTGSAIEVDPLDVKAIAAALVRASSDDRVRAELVTAGLQRSGELTWRAAAAQHVAMWEAMVPA
ncbi:MAG TPA: glycosyltransferase family 1 protein [Acidimicrobiales bacterium]|nr:glycosyltransferase family 1 protein [Acidimicrobiales bacterium]